MENVLNLGADVFAQLPQQGPGDDASTEQALRFAGPLPTDLRLLDVGCGSGRQSLALARLTNASITAVDLDVGGISARFAAAGLSDRLQVHSLSMDAMPFQNESFDILWSEGAIYNIGFGVGLRSWRRMLTPGGILAVTELSWLVEERPPAAVEFWKQAYPHMRSRDENLAEIAAAGYSLLADFVLPKTAWWPDFYDPMEARITELRKRFANAPEALGQLAMLQSEIDLFRAHSDAYNYVFYICARCET